MARAKSEVKPAVRVLDAVCASNQLVHHVREDVHLLAQLNDFELCGPVEVFNSVLGSAC